jgi:hypothetical protein
MIESFEIADWLIFSSTDQADTLIDWVVQKSIQHTRSTLTICFFVLLLGYE